MIVDANQLVGLVTICVLRRLPSHHPAIYGYMSYGGLDLAREYHYRVVSGAWSIKSNTGRGDNAIEGRKGAIWVAVHLESRSSCSASREDGLIDGTSLASVPLPAGTVAKSLSIQECDMPWLTRILCTRWDMPNDAMDLVVYCLEPHIVRGSVLRGDLQWSECWDLNELGSLRPRPLPPYC